MWCKDQQSLYKQRGFTILELLVVLLIIGLIVGMATISVGGNQSRVLSDEAQRLTALLDLAIQQSLLSGREMAMEVDPEGYRFLIYSEEKWESLEEVPEFRARQLPEGMVLQAVIEGQEAEENLFGETEASQIMILSSGEISPFTITLQLEDGLSYQLNGDLMGSLTLEGPLGS